MPVHVYPLHGWLPGLLQPLDHPMLQRKHGFEVGPSGDALQTITYDKTTQVVTITPTGASFRFWIDGVQFVKTSAQAAPAHAATTGLHYIYYDATGTLQVSTTAWGIRDRTVTPVALVYWSGTLSDGWCFYECHTADRTLEQHYHDHFSLGTQYLRGGALSGYTTGGGGDTTANVTFGIASATIADEDIIRALDAVADGGPYMTLWRTGASGEWVFDDTRTLPYEYDVGANYVAYNNPNGGGAGIWGLTSAGGGNFVPYFLCTTTSVQGVRQFFLVPGQTFTGTLAAAQAYLASSLAWGVLPFEELVVLYRIIFRTGAGYGTAGRGRIEEVTTVNGSISATLPGAPSVHGSLSGRSDPDQHPAAAITNTPAGTIVATTVQAALDGLDTTYRPISRGGTILTPSGAVDVIVWRAPFACEVLAVKGYRTGGTGATINARRNGVDEHLAADLSVAAADTWVDGGAVQNVSYAAGDKLEIRLRSVAGSPAQVGIQVDLRRM